MSGVSPQPATASSTRNPQQDVRTDLPQRLTRQRLDDIRAHVSNLLRRERASERRHVRVAAVGYRQDRGIKIPHLVEWCAAGMSALAVVTVTDRAVQREEA